MPRLKLEPAVAARLIDRLSTDDAFRERFTTDTANALHEVGHIADVAELNAFIGICFAGVKLADKNTIADARQQVHAMLVTGGHQSVPALDANQPRDRKLRDDQIQAA